MAHRQGHQAVRHRSLDLFSISNISPGSNRWDCLKCANETGHKERVKFEMQSLSVLQYILSFNLEFVAVIVE